MSTTACQLSFRLISQARVSPESNKVIQIVPEAIGMPRNLTVFARVHVHSTHALNEHRGRDTAPRQFSQFTLLTCCDPVLFCI